MKKLTKVVLFLVVTAGWGGAAPSITSASINSTTITISGTGFTSKSTAKPIVWADFATDINPSPLGQKTSWDGNDNLIRTASLPTGSGNSNGVVGTWNTATHAESFSFMTTKIPSWSKIYVYNKRYYDFEPTNNQKFFRLWNTETTGPNDFIAVYGNGAARTYNEINTDNPDRYQGEGYTRNTWLQEEFIWQFTGGTGLYLDNSAASGSGIWDYTRNGVQQQHMESIDNGSNTQTELRVLDNYTDAGSLPTDGSRVYMTDIYVDDTYSRVMIGNASTLASSTHREIFIPATWSTTGITATVNIGSFASNASVYLFVVDSLNVASSGYAITLGESASYNKGKIKCSGIRP